VPEKEQVLHSVAQRVHVVVVTIVVSAAVAVAGACEGVVADVGVPLPPQAESNTLQHAKVVGKLSLFFLNFCFSIESFIKPSQADFLKSVCCLYTSLPNGNAYDSGRNQEFLSFSENQQF
jgi:hypothetical protein